MGTFDAADTTPLTITTTHRWPCTVVCWHRTAANWRVLRVWRRCHHAQANSASCRDITITEDRR